VKIVVCMKQTPDTEATIKLTADKQGIEEQNIKWVMNPYDEFAVEQALKLKEKHGGETVVVCMGPDRVTEAMRTALAMGIDKGIHLKDPAFAHSDATGSAKALAAAIKPLAADLVLCGRRAIDWDMAQVPMILAELLNLPHVHAVAKMEMAADAKSAVCNRRIEGGEEVVEVKLPAVLTCDKGLNEPRYASLPGIMKAKKKEIKPLTLAESGLSANDVGKAASKVQIIEYVPLPDRPPGKVFKEQETDVMVKQVVKLLREEAKII
jgi:electron transfer flavoprotein beta subunit